MQDRCEAFPLCLRTVNRSATSCEQHSPTRSSATSGHGAAPLGLASLPVEPVVVGIVIAVAGVAVGLAAGLAFRLSERRREPAPGSEPASPGLPAGSGAVLAVLRSSAIVLDERLDVVQASSSTYTLGLVRQGRLVEPRIVELVGAVQRDGMIRDLQLSIERPVGALHLAARVGQIAPGRILVLVEDITASIRNDEIRRDFVANVSHELKTPVGAMTLLAEAVEDASDDPVSVRTFAGRIRKEGARLNRLVQEIIDLSRLQYDDPVQSAEAVDVDEVVAAALDRMRVDADAREVRLVSGGTAGVEVHGNHKQLVTALSNVVENAVVYSPDHTRVAVGVQVKDDIVEITVADQGYGIPEAEQSRVFERFYRVDPARSRATGGTGLGLSIVKHIAASHGGEVAMWSVPGAGSTFTLRLPLHLSGPGTSRPSMSST